MRISEGGGWTMGPHWVAGKAEEVFSCSFCAIACECPHWLPSELFWPGALRQAGWLWALLCSAVCGRRHMAEQDKGFILCKDMLELG